MQRFQLGRPANSLLQTMALFLSCFGAAAAAQVMTGTPPFQSFGGGPDIINLGNLNVHYSFPVYSRAGRGVSFNYPLALDSSAWVPSGSAWVRASGGLHKDIAALTGVITLTTQQTPGCGYGGGDIIYRAKMGIRFTQVNATYCGFWLPMSATCCCHLSQGDTHPGEKLLRFRRNAASVSASNCS